MRKPWILLCLASLGLAAPLWAVPPPLAFSLGPVNPGPQATGMNGVPFVMQLTVTNNATEFVNLNTLSFQASGSANDNNSSLTLYQDNDLSGIPDAGAIASATFGGDNSAATLSFGSVQIGAGLSQTFLIQCSGWTAPGTLVQTLFAASAIGGVSAQTSVNSGMPLASSTLTVLPPQLDVSVGPANPGPQSAGPAQQVVVLDFTVSNTGQEPVNFGGVQVQASGTADDTNDHLALATDPAGNGVAGTNLAGQNYTGDDGLVTLSISPIRMDPGTSQTFVLVANSGLSPGTMVRTISVVLGNGFYSGLPVQFSGAPLASAALTLPPPQVAFSFGPANPGPQTLGPGSPAVFMDFTISNTGLEAVSIQSLVVQASGTANDSGDGLGLFDDPSANGVAGTNEAAGSFVTDNGTVTLNPSPVITIGPGLSHTFLLQGPTGQSVGTLIRSISSVQGVGQQTSATMVTTGIPLNSAAVTVPPPQVAVVPGPVNPGPQTVAPNGTITYLEFTVSNTGQEAVNLVGVTLQASGSANDQSDTVTLYDDPSSNGVPGASDSTGTFATDNGSVFLAFNPTPLGPGLSRTYLVQGGTGLSVGTLVRGLSGLLATGQASLANAAATGIPLNSATMTLPAPTPSATPVVTDTSTPTASATPLVAPTNTQTPSPTPVLTPTNSWTPSATPVFTPTKTRTPSATPVQSPTDTGTATASPVQSATDTPVHSPSSTRTPTDTPVPSHTLTPVPTRSFTRTDTPTRSPTPVPTVNPNSPTPTLTPAAPAVLSRNLFRPSQGPLGISFKVLKNGSVTVRVYDLSGARVRTAYQSYAATGSGWIQAIWDGRNDRGQEVATGLYVVSIQGGGIQRLLKVAVLR